MSDARKMISRETFDGVVKENIEEFGMSSEEAIADAVKQFEAQGVDASAMVDTDDKKSIVDLISRLKVEGTDDLIDRLRQECDQSSASRTTAAANGAFELLAVYLGQNRKLALRAMASLLEGQPDLMDQDTVLLVTKQLRPEEPAEDIGAAAAIVAASCFKHEANRVAFVDAGVLPPLLRACDFHSSDVSVIRNACKALRALTRDDDIRVPYGRGSEHANRMVTQHDAIRILLKVAKEFKIEASVLAEVIGTLSRMAIRAEFCDSIVHQGALGVILESLMDHSKDAVLVRQSLGLLTALAGSDDAKADIVKCGGVETVLSAMSYLPLAPGVSEVSCACLAALALRGPATAEKIIVAGGARSIVVAMNTHPTSALLQRSACMAIRNLVSRTKENCVQFLEANAEEAIQVARKNHPVVEDEAKAALRDLGCKVVLRELWTGEKSAMS